jgi:molybdopterin-guanine dinucleotide biosynthesis protein A
VSSNPVGVVLAGGDSRRMGHDKALLQIGDRTWVEDAAHRLSKVCREVVIADRGRRSTHRWPSLPDGPGAGPAAGLLGAAAELPGRELLALACDLPRVPVELLRRLAAPFDGDLLAPRWRRGVEPLCARYRPPALELLAAEVAAGRLALHPLFAAPSLAVRYLEREELEGFGAPAELFLNLNRPEDLAAQPHPVGAALLATKPPGR